MKKLLAALLLLLPLGVLAGTPAPGQRGHHGQGSAGACVGCTHSINFLKGLPVEVTFTRASVGTYFDGTGTIQTAASNVPRLTYNPTTLVPEGLLIEEARTNVLKSSGVIGDGNWSNSGVTVSTANATGPDGLASATLVTNASTSTPNISQSTGSSATGNYSISGFVKAGTAASIILKYSDNTANACGALFTFSGTSFTNSTTGSCTVTSTAYQALPNGWYRLKIVVNFTAVAAALNYQVGAWDNVGGSATNGATFYAFGGQSENAQNFVTSYIPTAGSSVTRAVDKAHITPIPWFSPYKGAFVTKAVLHGSNTTHLNETLDFNDGSTNNRIYQYTNSNFGTFLSSIAIGGSAATSAGTGGSPSVNIPFKQGLSYRSAGNAAAYNGTLETGSGFIASGLPVGINRLTIGDRFGNDRTCNCAVAYIHYWNRNVTGTKLMRITP